jgi:hypothetical protein
MAHPGDVVEAPLFGARATFLETTEQTNGELLRVEVVLPPGFSGSQDAMRLGFIVSLLFARQPESQSPAKPP